MIACEAGRVAVSAARVYSSGYGKAWHGLQLEWLGLSLEHRLLHMQGVSPARGSRIYGVACCIDIVTGVAAAHFGE